MGFQIIQPENEEDYVRNIVGKVTTDNKVILKWEWPTNVLYNICCIFEVNSDTTTLDDLQNENKSPVTYYNNFAVSHSVSINARMKQFRIYPGRIDPQTGILSIVNQSRNNLSQKFLRKIQLSYSVYYEKKLFSKFKKAIISITGDDLDILDTLYYKVIDNNQGEYHYGIDLKHFQYGNEYEIYMASDQEVSIMLSKDQAQYVQLERTSN